MFKAVFGTIMELSAYSIVLPLIPALMKFRHLQQLLRVLATLVFISSFFELLLITLTQLQIQANTLPLLHIFTVLEFLLIANIYRLALRPLIKEGVLYGLMAFFVAFAIVNAWQFSNLLMFNDYARALECILIIVLVLCYFYKILTELSIQKLEKDPVFWISAGLLIYFSAGLFLFIFSNYFLSTYKAGNDEPLYILWGIHGIFNILLNFAFAIAFWVSPWNKT